MTSWQSPPFIVANLICTRMGNDISSWRMSIGLFYDAMYGAITKRYIGKYDLYLSIPQLFGMAAQIKIKMHWKSSKMKLLELLQALPGLRQS